MRQVIRTREKLAILLSVLLILFMFSAGSAGDSEDGGDCVRELDRLKEAASDAAHAAEKAESARQHMESKKQELEYCLRFPDIYSWPDPSCDSIRWSYASAKENYQSALSDLESKLDVLAATIRSVESSCGVQFSLPSDQSDPP